MPVEGALLLKPQPLGRLRPAQALHRVHEGDVDVVVVAARLDGAAGDGGGLLPSVAREVGAAEHVVGAVAVGLELDRLLGQPGRLFVVLLRVEDARPRRQHFGPGWARAERALRGGQALLDPAGVALVQLEEEAADVADAGVARGRSPGRA